MTGNLFFRTIAEEILSYVICEMTDPAGGFYSTQDANSESEEGKFFVWTPDEIRFQAPDGVPLARTGQRPSDSADLAKSQQLRLRPQLPSKATGLAGFFDTSDDHETLITRPRDLQDNATPSGNAMAVTALLKLAGLTNDLRYVDIAHEALAQMQPVMSQYPLRFGQWILALAYALSESREIATVGDPDSADTQALLSAVRNGHRPFQVVALGAPDRDTAVPLLGNRGLVDGPSPVPWARSL